METLKFIKQKYSVRFHQPLPISLPMERTTGLLELFNELGLKTGAEIGTSTGWYAKWLFHRIKGLKLYCVDPWEVYEDYTELHDKAGQPLYDQRFEDTKKRLVGKNVEFIKKYSMDAVKDFEDNSLDFVFIDGNHSFEYVVDDIAAWSKKVRPGGIISGHDYWNSIEQETLYRIGMKNEYPTDPIEKIRLCQVKNAVDGWTKAYGIKPWFITTPKEKERFPSWFWVKQ